MIDKILILIALWSVFVCLLSFGMGYKCGMIDKQVEMNKKNRGE